MALQGQLPPPQSGMSPMQYYMSLVQNGVSAYEAYQATSASFGAPKSREQLAQEQESANAKASQYATAGQVLGTAGTAYLMGEGAGLFSSAATGAGAATTAAETGAEAGTTAETPLGAYLGPVALAGGLYGGYQTAQQTGSQASGSQRDVKATVGGGLSGLAIGAGTVGTAMLMGAELGSWLGPVGMAVGALAGFAGSKLFGSKKGKAQFMRDQIRDVMQQGGILDDKYQGTLADGSKFDFGQDGSHLKWKEIDKIAADNQNAWSPTVSLTDALAAGYGFVGQKASDISAWYARAAVSNAGDDPAIAKANAQHFATQQGLTYDLIKGKLDEAIADNRINKMQYDSYLAGAKELTAGVTPESTASAPQVKIERPKKGEVLRVSPGLYRNDEGKLTKAKTMLGALELNYGKQKEAGVL